MIKKEIIDNISKNTKLRLKPSKVCDGVGLFSIVEIKEGEVIFDDVTADDIYIRWDEIPDLRDEVKNYLNSMCNSDPDGLYLSRTPNNINLAYFVNHSDNPNVFYNLELDRFIAIKDIGVDEEIVCVYNEDEKWIKI
jgi:hypothetical protein